MLIDNPEAEVIDLMSAIKGPDFPTAATIMGKSGIRSAYETGKGKIIIKSKTRFETVKGKTSLIVDEIPYEVNKANLVRKIDKYVFNKLSNSSIE